MSNEYNSNVDHHQQQQNNFILDSATRRLLDLTTTTKSSSQNNLRKASSNNDTTQNKHKSELQQHEHGHEHEHVEEIISILNSKAPKLLEGLCKQKQRNVASQIQVSCYARDEVVFQQDDEPDAFYTVIRGAVSIYAQNSTAASSFASPSGPGSPGTFGQQSKLEDENCSDERDNVDDSKDGETDQQQQQQQQSSSTDIRAQMRSQIYGKFLVQLAPGFGFGELSFNADGNHSKRSAGVVSDGSHGQSKVVDGDKEYEASNVAVLLLVPGETYLKEMFGRDIGKHQTKEKVDFLKSSFLFSMWSVDQLVEMSYGMKKQEFSPGSLLVRQGDRAENILIIKKGQIRVSIAIDTKKDDDKYATDDHDLLEVATLAESDLFGIVEAFQNFKKMKRSAIALTAVEVFTIQAPVFVSFLSQVPQTHGMLAKVVKKRTTWEMLRADYASKFPTMKLSLPSNFQKRLSEYQLSRGMVLTEREIKLRKARSFDLYKCMRNARSSYRVYVNETKGGSTKKAEEALQRSSKFCRQAIGIAEEIEDGKRRKQASDLLSKISGEDDVSPDLKGGKCVTKKGKSYKYLRESIRARAAGIENNSNIKMLISEEDESDDDDEEDDLTPDNRDQKISLLSAKAGLRISV
eukprot:CAMPEP_0116030724 /NCGR_PEP_ID=MMETSP0321-20121206/17035_1 /TAXON_ID=163516 /ORGANISM="Leptocylindrus danicus var. danicus, Strain B650" /LENGTH=632 /DNA_ID=CAMNT_0003505605 /DNA_START=82 /DNA_END=1980 /DNA_ORIENTATION=+